MKRILSALIIIILIFAVSTGCNTENSTNNHISEPVYSREEFGLQDIPDYSGQAYYVVNNNIPFFTEDEIVYESYEFYPELDKLGRCGSCIACVGKDLMPTEPRESISEIKPTGFKQAYYDIISERYLWTRAHLIGFMLTGENANERNLITGTKFMNERGMLQFEEQVASYIRKTNNHVMYRVTPMFFNTDLVAKGVLMEAYSVEDFGSGVCYNVFVYNIQPGISIDYTTGNSKLDPEYENFEEAECFILNTSSLKFHRPDCASVHDINSKNKQEYTGSREILIAQGYKPCLNCNP